jgi:hypothetical protein
MNPLEYMRESFLLEWEIFISPWSYIPVGMFILVQILIHWRRRK